MRPSGKEMFIVLMNEAYRRMANFGKPHGAPRSLKQGRTCDCSSLANSTTLWRVERFLEALGFVQIGKVSDQGIYYRPEAAALTGKAGAVYVFLNPDGRVWKVGMTRNGFARVNYTRVFDGRAMRRAHEKRKRLTLRSEVKHGATQWVLQADNPKLVEILLSCLLSPTESRRQQSKAERTLRRLAP